MRRSVALAAARLWGTGPLVVGLLGLGAVGAWFGADARALGQRNGGMELGEGPVNEAGWRERRAMLHAAGEARRSRRFAEALRLYLVVGAGPPSREDDASVARMWSARMRLERGEWSALVDLERWMLASPDPAWLARCVLMLRRVARAAEPKRSDECRRVAAVGVQVLRGMADALDMRGERALRWLSKVE